MKVYLVQHAEAKSEEEDPQRSLTLKGEKDAVNMAGMAAWIGVKVTEIRHSGKTRAEQTAVIMGRALAPAAGVLKSDDLGPVDDVVPVAEEITNSEYPIMLVGHLPFMSRMAGYLLTGDAEQAPVKFENAGILCLGLADDSWQVEWYATPAMVAEK